MSLPAHDHPARRGRLREQLDDLDLDALVVTHPVDVRWLSGLVASNGAVLVSRDGTELLWTDNRYAEAATATGMDVSLEPWIGHLAEAPGLADVRRVGVQAEHVSIATHGRIRTALPDRDVEPTVGVLARARRRKDDAELARLELACAITSQAWTWLVQQPLAGRSERDIARSLLRHLEDLGADGSAFDPIVASGPNSAIPHHHPTDRPLEEGEVLKVDFGAMVDGYHADCTRVLALGEPAARLREVHAEVRAAQQAGVEAAVVGANAGDVHEAAVGRLDALGIGPTLHGVGHGVGLEIHEAPILSSEPTATLESGLVITVEPGIYLTGIGGVRIEDTIVVTPDGPRRLTTCSHELTLLTP